MFCWKLRCYPIIWIFIYCFTMYCMCMCACMYGEAWNFRKISNEHKSTLLNVWKMEFSAIKIQAIFLFWSNFIVFHIQNKRWAQRHSVQCVFNSSKLETLSTFFFHLSNGIFVIIIFICHGQMQFLQSNETSLKFCERVYVWVCVRVCFF